ncbi:MAG TPA: hypothetical protein ENG83_07545 [Nitrospirae bacterium]|nr:hypothetical protein BMS3Abin06_01663 [bacterium BMS3Abin06]HDH12034.1 hypothetical protein [Nitrospirota bacterium]HDZ00854.1 hypothetical protein [Nitrospirota bacterium]
MMKTHIKHKQGKIFIHSLILVLLLIISGCGGGGGSGSSGSGVTASGESGSSSDGSGSTAISSATLSWDAPTTNSDGTPLTDLAGYKVYYGTSSSNYTESVDIGNTTGAVVDSLSPGTWCFAVTAYDTSGNESDYSNEVCTSIG